MPVLRKIKDHTNCDTITSLDLLVGYMEFQAIINNIMFIGSQRTANARETVTYNILYKYII